MPSQVSSSKEFELMARDLEAPCLFQPDISTLLTSCGN